MAREVAERAHPAFQFTGWKWRQGRPPTQEEIEETALRLLTRVQEMGEENPGQTCSSSTGRLTAYREVVDCYVVVGVDLNLAEAHEEASREVIEAKYAEADA